MTRRQRHMNIIENFGDHRADYELHHLLVRHGFNILSDDGIEKLAAALVKSHRLTQKYNRENRARIAAQKAA